MISLAAAKVVMVALYSVIIVAVKLAAVLVELHGNAVKVAFASVSPPAPHAPAIYVKGLHSME